MEESKGKKLERRSKKSKADIPTLYVWNGFETSVFKQCARPQSQYFLQYFSQYFSQYFLQYFSQYSSLDLLQFNLVESCQEMYSERIKVTVGTSASKCLLFSANIFPH